MGIAGRTVSAQRLFWLVFAAGALARLAGLLVDAEPRFFLGDSHVYLITRPDQGMPADRSWTYGLALWLLLGLTHRLASALALQCVLTALTIALVAFAARRAGLPAWAAALLAAALHAHPLPLYYERSLLTETAGTAALVAGVTLCIAALRSGSPATAAAAAASLVAAVSLRTVFAPAAVTTALIAGAAGILSALPRRGPAPRSSRLAAGLTVAGATAAGLVGYAVLTGHLTGRRPSINPDGGFFLAGAVAPLLEPADFAGRFPGDAAKMLARARHREWDLRPAQIFGRGGIADRLQRRLGSRQAAADAAQAASLAAIRRDPAAFARHVLRQAREYLDPDLPRDHLPVWAGLARPLPESLIDDLRRRVTDPPAPGSPAVPSPVLSWLEASARLLPLLVWAGAAVTVACLALLPRAPRDARPGLALAAAAVAAYFGSVCAFGCETEPRYLLPLVPLVALGAGLVGALLPGRGVGPDGIGADA